MIRGVWKMCSLFLSLGAFLAVGAAVIDAGEELVWAVGKSVGSFVICWMVLNQLGAILFALVERQEKG